MMSPQQSSPPTRGPRCFGLPPYTWDLQDLRSAPWADREPDEEPMGTKEKEWVHDADGRPWLFKEARSKHGVVRGEDWAECVVHALAGLLGVPSACVCPAVRDGRRGVLSRSVLGDGDRLEHGNELLSVADPAYDKTNARNPGYTVDAVRSALELVGSPMGVPDFMTGFEAWAGYLVLDAWVSGCDRHHENWAVIRSQRTLRLAPSFDHGNALGFQEPEGRLSGLTTPDKIERWSKRGVNRYFRGNPNPVALVAEALRSCGQHTTEYWLGRLEDVSEDHVNEILHAPPDRILSGVRRTFIQELLRTNRKRILSAIDSRTGSACSG